MNYFGSNLSRIKLRPGLNYWG